jgi:ribonuclease-3
MPTTAEARRALEARLGHTFRNPELLELALRHASIADSRVRSNERLEFLGDAVLGLIACQRIYELYPDLLEGEMTKIKSLVVSRQSCAQMGDQIGLTEFLVLGKGMKPGPNQALPMSLSAAALEAIVAAIYLDAGPERGLQRAREFLLPLLEDRIAAAAASGHQENFKSILQHHVQQTPSLGMHGPVYVVLDERGPDHAKQFQVCVIVGERRFEPAWGPNKKQAEQQAAVNALRELGVVTALADGRVQLNHRRGPGERAAGDARAVPAQDAPADGTPASDAGPATSPPSPTGRDG